MNDVVVGQVWEDMDPRMMRANILTNGPARQRRFRIYEVYFDVARGDVAWVEDVDTGLKTHISLRRLRPGKRGYRLVEEGT
jgi:hypothetical protein